MCVMVCVAVRIFLDLCTLFNLACHIPIAGSNVLDRDYVPAHIVT